MEVLHNPPEASSFIPLAEHQSHTPASFYSGPPILHHLSERCKIVVLERELSKSAALSGLRPIATGAEAVNGASVGESSVSATAPAAAGSDDEKEIVIDGVDVWVTSERLLLYSQPANTGVAIPYPSISLHAIQRLQIPNSNSSATLSTGDENTVQGLYMQLATDSNDNQEDEDMEDDSTCLTIVPPPPPPQSQPQPQAQGQEQQQQEEDNLITPEEEENKPSQTPTQDLFAAVSACSNLHPDPASQPGSDDEGDADMQDNPAQQLDGSILYQNGLIIPGNNAGGLPPAMPGSGGWITAENVHEYFDDEGNWKGGDGNEGEEGEEAGGVSLGPGAGTVRPREEGGEENAAGDDDADAGEGEEETKWRRTG
ncbi:chloride channel, nucleotide-sensitive, 1A [Blastomyces parvus]|uniref:Chloride channel, nucleotide-sensitive, 1A n=1 Tax=Blastomyces parvus TaxID=2060905 RepID=A0A2B7X6J7_9EURO|nr:chloride channel, nucleotide-sensitive, 1A [Blastomyces parvus]